MAMAPALVPVPVLWPAEALVGSNLHTFSTLPTKSSYRLQHQIDHPGCPIKLSIDGPIEPEVVFVLPLLPRLARDRPLLGGAPVLAVAVAAWELLEREARCT